MTATQGVLEYSAPTATWTTITDAEIAAATSTRPNAVSPGLLMALRSNDEHLRQLIDGVPLLSGGLTAHDHSAVNGGNVAQMPGHALNVIMNSAPLEAFKAVWDYDKRVVGFTKAGLELQGSAGVTLQQQCPMRGRTEERKSLNSAALHGSGSRMTGSLFVKLGGTATKGLLSFGFADGGSEFSSGCKSSVFYKDLSASAWTRVYGFFDVPAPGTDVRWTVSISEQFDSSVIVNGFQVHPGHFLTYWLPSVVDSLDVGGYFLQWAAVAASSCPMWEKATAITNALRCYPR